jgi:hypothetical protein
MILYPLTQEERDQLVALNHTDACWAACRYGTPNEGPNCVCIEQDTLDNPAFAAHKALFDTFPPRDSVDYTPQESNQPFGLRRPL